MISPPTGNRIDAARVMVMLAQLDEIYQAPVALFYLQDYSYGEIADILEVPLRNGQESRLARGLGHLHQLLTGEKNGRTKIIKFVNHDEAKNILLLYRHGTTDADMIRKSLGRTGPGRPRPGIKGLAGKTLRATVCAARTFPAGQRACRAWQEQILSEQAAQEKVIYWRPKFALAAVAVLFLLVALVPFLFSHRSYDDTLAILPKSDGRSSRYAPVMRWIWPRMIRCKSVPILQRKSCTPQILSGRRRSNRRTLAGCAVEGWQGAKVSMICFRTGNASVTDGQSGLLVVRG